MAIQKNIVSFLQASWGLLNELPYHWTLTGLVGISCSILQHHMMTFPQDWSIQVVNIAFCTWLLASFYKYLELSGQPKIARWIKYSIPFWIVRSLVEMAMFQGYGGQGTEDLLVGLEIASYCLYVIAAANILIARIKYAMPWAMSTLAIGLVGLLSKSTSIIASTPKLMELFGFILIGCCLINVAKDLPNMVEAMRGHKP